MYCALMKYSLEIKKIVAEAANNSWQQKNDLIFKNFSHYSTICLTAWFWKRSSDKMTAYSLIQISAVYFSFSEFGFKNWNARQNRNLILSLIDDDNIFESFLVTDSRIYQNLWEPKKNDKIIFRMQNKKKVLNLTLT